MDHLLILPLILPLLGGLLMLLPPLSKSRVRQRNFALGLASAMILISILLVVEARPGEIIVYHLGNWAPPFGIALVGDRLSTLLVLLTSVLAFCSLLYTFGPSEEEGSFFQPLMQFQLLGINGAFLTGDIFNLFVFFEVLLIASYGLLMFGGGKRRTRAGLHYVILNLAGSAVFLFALGILYGTLGTLNIADMARQVQLVDPADLPLVKAGGLMLLIVFGLKAAILPLQFWLPAAYSAAAPAVAALFAIMTKVGIYAILRVFTVVFGDSAGDLSGLAGPWLWWLSLLTLTIGGIGVLAAKDMRRLVAHLIIISVGTLLAGIGLEREAATSAALYYLIHTTLVSAGLFLLADLIGRQRGKAGDRLIAARPMHQGKWLSILYLIGALAVIGMPPLSGFVGKALLMKSALAVSEMQWFWPVLLISSLVALIKLSRAGSNLFWHITGEKPVVTPVDRAQLTAVILLLSTPVLMSLFGGPLTELTDATAQQLHDVPGQIGGVLRTSLAEGSN
ncbi:monovalent cation/H+ antiporter subunit D [Marinobacterium nitratireducens]|uniref:Monovalent cation/H+ antiporter subunit D n=1 Tax=Marinobacterium nitratireducens TaxID=518897 RepID=A0A917Z8X9_9GAMM|nr:monovalent cation/H+ antiporter subunit D [Marinobacterium nitratireducens]GGO77702.1 monovalent cation/H+ antiporter subunit D [Marinobacterium nitratireducens]